MLRCRADDLQSLRERSTADATRLRKRPISRRGKRVTLSHPCRKLPATRLVRVTALSHMNHVPGVVRLSFAERHRMSKES